MVRSRGTIPVSWLLAYLLASAGACGVNPIDEPDEGVGVAEQELGPFQTFCGFTCPSGWARISYICDSFCGNCSLGPFGSPPNAVECVPPAPAGNVSASPEAVQIVPGSVGSTEICFQSNVAYSQVWVSMNGGSESLFASEHQSGCASASWIQLGQYYDFRYYAGQSHTQLLDTVRVTGVPHTGDVNASPADVHVAPGTVGTSRICFSSDAPSSQVWVSMDGGPESPFASAGYGGDCSDAWWIQLGHVYDFRLYAGDTHSGLLDQVRVRGVP